MCSISIYSCDILDKGTYAPFIYTILHMRRFMKYIRVLNIITPVFEVYILFFMLQNELNITNLYLTDDWHINQSILVTMIFVVIMETLIGFFSKHKLKRLRYLSISSILSTILGCIWAIMFFNVLTHDHFRTLTPLLLYLSLTRLIISWYLADFSKE